MYVTNPNYVYEGFKKDTDVIKRLRVTGEFWMGKDLGLAIKFI